MPIGVVALNLGHSALGIGRALAPQGIRVHVFDARAGGLGAGSRYLEVHRAPDAGAGGGVPLRDCLTEYAAAWSTPPILFPTRDLDVTFVDAHRDILERSFAIAQPRHDILDSIINKTRLLRAAAEFGLATPRTMQFDPPVMEPPTLPDDLAYPVIIKPVYAHQAHAIGLSVGATRAKAHLADSREDALAHSRHLLAKGIEIFVQEFIPGTADRLLICAGYLAPQGVHSGAFTARKLLQYPEDAGIGRIVETTDQPELAATTLAFLKRIGYHGIFEAEFKQGTDGVPYLIEINPRHWDQHLLGSACGIDVSILAINDLARRAAPTPVYHYRRAVWYDDPFITRLALARDPHWLRLKRNLPPNSSDILRVNSVFAGSDPLPALRVYARFALELMRRRNKRLRAGSGIFGAVHNDSESTDSTAS